MVNGLPHRPPDAIRVVYLDLTRRCEDCGDDMPPGTPMQGWSAGEGAERRAYFRHDGGCPPRWTPVLLDGGGERSAPMLPLLAVVRDDEAVR